MSSIHAANSVLSANDLFKSGYQKVLRRAILVAIILTGIACWLSPRYSPTPYVLREKFFQIENFEIIEDLEIPEKPPAKAPVIVREIEPVKGELEEEFILPDTFQFDNYPLTTMPRGKESGLDFFPLSSNPVLIHFSKPDYPEIARRSRLEGMVIVKVLVDKNGNVERTEIIQGINPILNKAASDAARKCRFKPGTQRTIPVNSWVSIPYSFSMKSRR